MSFPALALPILRTMPACSPLLTLWLTRICFPSLSAVKADTHVATPGMCLASIGAQMPSSGMLFPGLINGTVTVCLAGFLQPAPGWPRSGCQNYWRSCQQDRCEDKSALPVLAFRMLWSFHFPFSKGKKNNLKIWKFVQLTCFISYCKSTRALMEWNTQHSQNLCFLSRVWSMLGFTTHNPVEFHFTSAFS